MWYKEIYRTKRNSICLWSSSTEHYWILHSSFMYWGTATYDEPFKAGEGLTLSSLLEVSLLGRDVPTERPPR